MIVLRFKSIVFLLSFVVLIGCDDRTETQKSLDTAKVGISIYADAEKGEKNAQSYLGEYYLYHKNGRETSEDLTESVRWLQKAAEQDYPSAQFMLGKCCFNGDGFDSVNKEEAVAWFSKAAEQGHSGAQYRLACCYYDGDGIRQDRVLAVAWFRRAAEQGHLFAQHRLCLCCYNGEGTAKDRVEAEKWRRVVDDRLRQK